MSDYLLLPKFSSKYFDLRSVNYLLRQIIQSLHGLDNQKWAEQRFWFLLKNFFILNISLKLNNCLCLDRISLLSKAASIQQSDEPTNNNVNSTQVFLKLDFLNGNWKAIDTNSVLATFLALKLYLFKIEIWRVHFKYCRVIPSFKIIESVTPWCNEPY